MSTVDSSISTAIGEARSRPPSRIALYGIVALFFVSGIAALIYQVCWQRLLFESVGVDIESVTIIVSTFMLGLGLGSLAGGDLVDRYPKRTIELFAAIELATGIFGILSPYLIHAAAHLVVNSSRVVVGGVNFGLLLIPTTLMGATLPILVAHLVRSYRNLGVSVGVLYFSNTLGAALGAAFTGFLAFYYLALSSTIFTAAAINIAVSAAVWFSLRVNRV